MIALNSKWSSVLLGTTTAAALVTAPTAAHAQAATRTFEYTGAPESFTVPDGVCELTVDAYGAAGGDALYGASGGLGGGVHATASVTPGQTLTVDVGGAGTGGNLDTGEPARGGYGGGGRPGGYMGTLQPGNGTNGGGGGGATTVAFAGAEPFIIGGGGGGGAGSWDQGTAGRGGDGGQTGTDGGSPPEDSGAGQGGESGGNGGGGGAGGIDPDQHEYDGLPGGAANGRTGGDGAVDLQDPHMGTGGGGGGGAHGGGAGGSSSASTMLGGGGGGGSSLGPAGATYSTGVRDGNGLVTLTYEPDSCASPPPPSPSPGKLRVDKTADKRKVYVGGRVHYRIHVANTGGTTLTRATVRDKLSGVLDSGSLKGRIEATSGKVTRAAQSFTWTGRLAPGKSADITYTVIARKPGVLHNLVTWKFGKDSTYTKVWPRPGNCRSANQTPIC